jgi:hypothetical protein
LDANELAVGVIADRDQVGDVRGTVLGQNVILMSAEPCVDLIELPVPSGDSLDVVSGGVSPLRLGGDLGLGCENGSCGQAD